MTTTARDFRLEVLVDFCDDALRTNCPITPQHIDSMMQALKQRGIGRVSWADYGDANGGFFLPGESAEGSHWHNYAATLQLLGDPLRVAATAAHRHGLELYAYFKPYETGPGLLFPEGSPQAQQWGRLAQIGGRLSWLDRFVVDNPQLRLQRRPAAPASPEDAGPLTTLHVVKNDAAATRVKPGNLQVWGSDNNYAYTRLNRSPVITEEMLGGARCFTLRGEALGSSRYLLVTTDFVDDPADFSNAGTSMLVARDAAGREIEGCIASGLSIWRRGRTNFRDSGLDFDTGCGFAPVQLDGGPQHFVAFTAGRNAYLPAALCETEPAVQNYWLSWVERMLDAGVDGIDLREEGHSTHTDYPADYGYNPAVLAQCDSMPEAATLATVRGNAYTHFIGTASAACRKRGRKLRINFQVDWYRPEPPIDRRLAYPANIDFQWQRWIEEGLADEAIFRFYALPPTCTESDPIAQQLLALCAQHRLPVVYNRYIGLDRGEPLPVTLARIRGDQRFCGFIFYETASFVDFEEDGGCRVDEAVLAREPF